MPRLALGVTGCSPSPAQQKRADEVRDTSSTLTKGEIWSIVCRLKARCGPTRAADTRMTEKANRAPNVVEAIRGVSPIRGVNRNPLFGSALQPNMPLEA